MTNNGPYTTEELIKKVKELVGKYRGHPNREDLKSEAYLAYYTAVDTGVTDESRLITLMRKAIYHTAKSSVVPTKVPKGGNTYKLTKELSTEEFDSLNDTDKQIYLALRDISVDFGDVQEYLSFGGISTEDTVGIRKAFDEYLTTEERFIVARTVIQDYTLQEVSDELGYTRQRIQQKRKEALEKLKEKLDA